MDCLFCKIVSKEIPAEIIHEDEHTVAFLDVSPLTRGHTLVIPKKHAENLLNLPEELVGPTFSAVRLVSGMLEEALNSKGFTIGINHGRISGQAVDHLHIHVVPRFENDGGGNLHSIVHNPPNEDISKTAETIRSASK